MSSRRTTTAFLVAPLLLVPVAGSDARKVCAVPDHAIELKRSSRVVLYRLPAARRVQGDLWACARKTDRRIRLTRSTRKKDAIDGVYTDVSQRVIRRYVSVEGNISSRSFNENDLRVFDVQNRKVSPVVAPAVQDIPKTPEDDVFIEKLVISKAGAVAWSVVNPPVFTDAIPEIYTFDGKDIKRLDSGYLLDTESLHIRQERLTWMQGGIERSAAITPPPYRRTNNAQ